MKSKRNLLWMTAVFLLVAMPFAGIVVAAQDDTTATAFLGIGYDEAETGVLVTQVVAGSPAEEAGLLVDDIITAINDVTVNIGDIADVIAGYSVGDVISLDVERGDETLALEATLAERPAEDIARPPRNTRPQVPMMNRPYLGVIVEDGDTGVVISDVVDGSPAQDADLQVDDIITTVNDTEVANSAALAEALQQMEDGATVSLGIIRGDESMTVDVTLGTMRGMDMMQNMPPFNFGDGMFSGLDADIQYLSDEGVLVINSLGDNSPLAEAGLMAGDRITAINGVPPTMDELPNLMGNLNADEPITLTVDRDGETVEVEIDMQNLLPLLMGHRGLNGILRGDFGQNFPPNLPNMPMIGDRARLGVTFVTLDETTAAQYGVDATEGALVTEVAENSAAAQAGLQVEDIITAVDGDVVDTERTLADRILAYEPGDVITLSVTRAGESLDIEVTLGRFEQSTDLPGFGMNFGRGGPFTFRGNHGFGERMPFGQTQPDEQGSQSTPNGDL